MKLIPRSYCPVCLSTERQIVYKKSYSSSELQKYLLDFYCPQGYPDVLSLEKYDFELAFCKNCALHYQVWVPDDESLTELYTRWISEDLVFEKFEKRRELNYLLNNFIIFLNLIDFFGSRNFKLLDYGFGAGHLIMQAHILGIDCWGYEINRKQISWALNNKINLIDFDKNKKSNYPKMDVIFCEQVLEHAVNPREVMENIASVSKTGTILHLSVPDASNIGKVLNNVDWKNMKGNEDSVNVFAPLEHINSFAPEQLIFLADQFGFKPYYLPNKFEIVKKLIYQDFEMKNFI